MGVLWGKVGERGCAILTPNELVLPFGSFYVCANFGENRSRNATRESARRRTDTLTHTLTDANRFYNLSHAICYSYGADNKLQLKLMINDSSFFLSLVMRAET